MVYPCIQIFKDKWFGILHHVLNEHHWLTGAQCYDHDELTGPLVDPDGNELQYFSRQEPAFHALRKILTDKRWLKSLKYYTKFRSVFAYIYIISSIMFCRHTDILECFHSHLLCYCPKRITFQ